MKDINLYINNQEIEFSISPDILFTYQQDDLTNPTVVKNNFSKTVMIKGTPKNNKIFGEIWNVERIQGSDNYNASKRVPFSLYINGDLYTTGYAKLDKVNMVNNDINYSITLYGGLGSFLYNLSYDWNTGDKKTLKDLRFFKGENTTEEFEFNFNINKDTVASAWTWSNMSSSSSEWYHINFAPSYIGTPDNLSSDKVLINFNDLPVGTSAVTSGDTAFTTYNGYALGTLPRSMTQEETRDFRAYLQTPVVRVKSVFDAICRKENNQGLYDNGFDVELDNDFFTPSNPFYWDSWMTLPLITSLEVSKTGDAGGSTAYTGSVYTTIASNGGYEYTFLLPETVTGGGLTVKAVFDLAVNASTTSDTLYMYYTKRYGRGQKYYVRNAYGVQLYASNSVASGGNALAASHIKWLTGGQKLEYSTAVSNGVYTPKYSTTVDNFEGTFTKVSGNTFKFTTQMEVSCDLPIGSTCFKLNIGRCNSTNNNERTQLFTSTLAYTGEHLETTLLPFASREITISKGDESGAFSNRRVTKDLLLDTSYSPADWLLSYIKMFGLYIYKDEIEDKIYIKTRNNFYDRDVNHIVDIEHLIDRGNSADLNPIFCQYAHLELKNDTEKSRPEQDYEAKFNKIYGEKIVNTGYEFNADTKNVFEKNVLKGAVQSKEVSDMFYKPSSGVHPYFWNNLSYNLYANGDATGGTYEVKQGTLDIASVFEPYDESYPGYDYIGKPMFADADKKTIDNNNVMLFFNGYKDVSGYNWILSDDVSEMFTLNNNPCWLLSVSTANTNGVEICKKISDFPRFSRMFEGNNWMIYSWDFGSPREMYIPSMVDNPEGNIYYNYFKDFYTDLYDVDTRVLTCNIKPGLKFSNEDLRRIYWFRNKYWRLNKITDYNPTNYNTTKSEFISVSDVNSLSNYNATSEVTVKVYLEKYCVGSGSTTIIGTVKTSDNGSWTIESVSVSSPSGTVVQDVTVSPDAGGSSGTFSLILPDNPNYDRVITIYVTAGDTGASTKCTQAGAYSTFYCPEDELIYETSGGIYTITMTNPANLETIVISKPDWVRVNPRTENSGTTLSIIASENHTAEERNGEVIIKDIYHNVTYTIPINQKCHTITSIMFNSLDWVIDVPSSGGTADKDNCLYQVLGFYSDGGFIDVTSSVTITGSIVVTANTSTNRLDIGNLVLTASLGSLTAERTVKAYQTGKVLISVGFSGITSTKDVCYLGGYVDESYCSAYTVIAYWDNLINEDITSLVDVTFTGFYVEETRNPERTYVGDLILTVTYGGKTGIGVLPIYQEAYVDYLRFNVISGGTIGIIDRYYGEGYSNVHITYEYKLNCGEWFTASATSLPSINVREGDVVLLRNHRWLYPASNYHGGYMQVITSSGAVIDVEGNILSLLDGDNFESITDLENFRGTYFVFKNFFEGSDVRSAKDLKLKATKLPNAAYRYMFANCTNLIDTPIFAEEIDVNDYCYANMFEGCVSLTKAPVCITSIISGSVSGSANYYCASMFEGCVSLEIPPAIQHTISSSVGDYGYKALTNMFSGCTSLLVSPDIPVPFGEAGDLGFYDGLFGRCSNLEYIRCLHYSPREEYLDTRDWVVGVANNGVFVKSSSVPDSAWTPHNAHACPSGWVMEDYNGNDLALVKLVYEDIPYTGGTAQIDVSKCRTFLVKNDSVTEVTSSSTISSTTLTVSATTATTRQKVGTVSVTAQYSGYTTTRTVDIYQTPIQEEPMFIYFNNTKWERNVPPEGGVATSANCSFDIILYYNTGRREYVTSSSTVSGSLIVSATTACTQEQVGSFTLTATYSGFTASTTVYVYQEGNCLTFEILPYQPYDEETEEGIWDTNIYWQGYGGRGIQYNINNTKNGWTNLGVRGRIENVQPGDIIRFRGTETRYGGNEKFLCTYFGTEVPFNVRGNIGSLIDYNNVSGITSATSYMFTYLFNNCNVVDASGLVLPWSVADEGAYGNMFEGCTGLTKSPYIMAETVGSNTLKEMFKGCSNLSEIVCMATNAGTGYSDGWTNGVSATGRFVKNPNMSGWTRGVDGIPNGWSVVNY